MHAADSGAALLERYRNASRKEDGNLHTRAFRENLLRCWARSTMSVSITRSSPDRLRQFPTAISEAVHLSTLGVLLCATTSFYTLTAAASEMQAQVWAARASAGLGSRVIETLRQISGPDRQLLAIRSYLRAENYLAQRWSWSQEQISAYPATSEGKAAAAEIDAVIAAFEGANPGYSLRVNRQPRSLEVQIEHWNANESVGSAAAALVAALERRFVIDGAAPSPDQLRGALKQWKPDMPIALAAPGLSPHGQGRAFDFQIERGGQIIAGTSLASATRQWDSESWTEKLNSAVVKAGAHLAGPLESPYEPWHYSYTPTVTSSGKTP